MIEGPAEQLVFFDLECSGLNPKRHEICEIAAIAVCAETLRELESFEMKVQFDPSKADPKALGINKYDPEIWSLTAIAPELVAEYFAQFLRRHATRYLKKQSGGHFQVAQLVAHNGAFDGPFLQAWYQRLGTYLPAARQVLCTMQRSLWLFASEDRSLTPPADYKLATLANYYNVSTKPTHQAMNDVRATIEVYRAINEHLLALTSSQSVCLNQLARVSKDVSVRRILDRAINAAIRELAA